MATIIKTTERPENPSAIWELFPHATILVEVNAKSRDHIRIDNKGNRLFVTKENEFIVDGNCIFKGEFHTYRWDSGVLAIALLDNEKNLFSIQIEDKTVFSCPKSELPEWNLVKGKLAIVHQNSLIYDGQVLLKGEDMGLFLATKDAIFMEKDGVCYEVLLSD